MAEDAITAVAERRRERHGPEADLSIDSISAELEPEIKALVRSLFEQATW